jgi:hypothetical protein
MAVRILAGVTLAGMSLLLLQPLPLRHSRSHECDRPGAVTTHAVVLTHGSVGCDHADGVCLATTGCVTAPAAVSPTRMPLSAPEVPRSHNGLGITLAADLFRSGPPTPPPNS